MRLKREGRVHEEYIRRLQLSNEVREQMVEASKELLRSTVEAEAKAVASEFSSNDQTGEAVERIKLTLRSFAKLIDQGAEIHPALTAPVETRDLFPDYKTLPAIESLIKRLTKGKDTVLGDELQ